MAYGREAGDEAAHPGGRREIRRLLRLLRGAEARRRQGRARLDLERHLPCLHAGGRCVSLLKILLTNYCLYDCAYCINRRSSNVPRARFAVQEVVDLTIAFYKRNYIEGLFLSSGIASPPTTRWKSASGFRAPARGARLARYILLKTISEASEA